MRLTIYTTETDVSGGGGVFTRTFSGQRRKGGGRSLPRGRLRRLQCAIGWPDLGAVTQGGVDPGDRGVSDVDAFERKDDDALIQDRDRPALPHDLSENGNDTAEENGLRLFAQVGHLPLLLVLLGSKALNLGVERFGPNAKLFRRKRRAELGQSPLLGHELGFNAPVFGCQSS